MFAIKAQNIEVIKLLLNNTETKVNATNTVRMDRGSEYVPVLESMRVVK